MRRVARHEEPARPVAVGERDARLPEAEVLDLHREGRAHHPLEMGLEVEAFGRRSGRHRRVEEEARALVDAAEELPPPLVVGVQDVEERLARIALQELVELGRAEHEEHHRPLLFRAGLGDASGLPQGGTAAVAADRVTRAKGLARGPVGRLRLHADARRVRRGAGAGPAVADLGRGQLGRAGAEHALGRVLRQPFVGGEVVVAHPGAVQEVEGIVGEELAIAGQAADAGRTRHDAGLPQARLATPGVEVLGGPLGEVLALRDRLRLGMALEHADPHAALGEIDGEAHADRPAADDDHVVFAHSTPCSMWMCLVSRKSASPSGPCSRPRPDWP